MGGYKAARKLIDSGSKFTALVASDDNCAIGAMKAIRDAGLQIPRDIAIIGFDDQPDAVAQVPPLASIHVPLGLIGEQALTLMFDHITLDRSLEALRFTLLELERQGLVPIGLSTHQATLDDVFLQLTGRGLTHNGEPTDPQTGDLS